jgi:hypothetical protein
MPKFTVIVPFAGHIEKTVEAATPEEARGKVFEGWSGFAGCDQEDYFYDYELLDRFHAGNVCYCPSPWELTIEEQE